MNSLIQYLKHLNHKKKDPLFHSTLNKIFSEELSNVEFCEWSVLPLEIRPSKFLESIERWNVRQFVESRGRTVLDIQKQQLIYDTWIKNSINSADARNGGNMIRISKKNYLENYKNIENKDIVIEEKENKRGRKCFMQTK